MILTTGTRSSLGRYLHENMGGIGLTRSTRAPDIEKIKRDGADVIIHCAFNAAISVSANSLYAYLYDNVLLTKELVSLRHKKFIFISTVDVYPKSDDTHTEDESIKADSLGGLYGVTKLMSESIVMNHCENYLILRATALLGKYSRKNSLISMIEEKDSVLTLSADSRFNYVLYSDILKFIKFAIDSDFKGIYNVASSENIILSEIADMVGHNVKFGDYRYDVGNVNNSKIISVFPAFKKTSAENITQFMKERR